MTITTIDSPGNLKGIATPVCALARNDVFFFGALIIVNYNFPF